MELELHRQALGWTALLLAFLWMLLVGGVIIELATRWQHRRRVLNYHRRRTDMPLRYDNELCNQFIQDMKERGLECFHYQGRFFYQGPGVDVDQLQEAMQHTKVPLQWDSLGLGFVVYPKASGKLIEETDDEAA